MRQNEMFYHPLPEEETVHDKAVRSAWATLLAKIYEPPPHLFPVHTVYVYLQMTENSII